jgi:hypothetical protein
MPVRALENGVWVAAADKWGTEAGSIVYAGRSLVIDPAGVTRVRAPSDQETVVVYDLEPMASELVPRRPALYRSLVEPVDKQPIVEVLAEPLVPALENRRVAVVPSNGSFDARATAARFRELRAQDADLVVFGGADGPEGWQVELPVLGRPSAKPGAPWLSAWRPQVVQRIGPISLPTSTTEHRHPWRDQPGTPSLVPTSAGNVALMCGEGLSPRCARLMLPGPTSSPGRCSGASMLDAILHPCR